MADSGNLHGLTYADVQLKQSGVPRGPNLSGQRQTPLIPPTRKMLAVPPRGVSLIQQVRDIAMGVGEATMDDVKFLIVAMARLNAATDAGQSLVTGFLPATFAAALALLERTEPSNIVVPHLIDILQRSAVASPDGMVGALVQAARHIVALQTTLGTKVKLGASIRVAMRTVFDERATGLRPADDPAYVACLEIAETRLAAFHRKYELIDHETVRREFTLHILKSLPRGEDWTGITADTFDILHIPSLPRSLQLRALQRGADGGEVNASQIQFVPESTEEAMHWMRASIFAAGKARLDQGWGRGQIARELSETFPAIEVLKRSPSEVHKLLQEGLEASLKEALHHPQNGKPPAQSISLSVSRMATRVLGKSAADSLVTEVIARVYQEAPAGNNILFYVLADEVLPDDAKVLLLESLRSRAMDGANSVRLEKVSNPLIRAALIVNGWVKLGDLYNRELTSDLVLPILAKNPERLAEIRNPLTAKKFADLAGLSTDIRDTSTPAREEVVGRKRKAVAATVDASAHLAGLWNAFRPGGG